MKNNASCFSYFFPLFIYSDILSKYFSNLEGFPYNTIGSNSIAFLIFYDVLEDFDGNLNKLVADMKNFSAERIAYNISETLDIVDNLKNKKSIDSQEFINKVLSLSIPLESKISILDIYSNYQNYLTEISPYLITVIDFLKQKKAILIDIINNFSNEVSQYGANEVLNKISTLETSKDVNYNMKPFIFGMDTVLTSSTKKNTINVYSGILRKELLYMINGKNNTPNKLYEAFNLLGDRTRFDILCYLHKQRAYGQELSTHFNLSRNTIHHHMNKLSNYGVITSTTDGNRVYYSLNTSTFKELIEYQKELFLI